MTAAKKPPAEPLWPKPVLIGTTEGIVHFQTPRWRYRYLFANGDVVTVEADHVDGSDIREAVLKYRDIQDDKIVGGTSLGPVPEKPKRIVKR